MSSAETLKLVEAIGVIKSSKRHGCAPGVVARQLKLPESDGLIEGLSDFSRNYPELAASLAKSESIYFDEAVNKFFFKFPQQFKSAYEFDLALKERSPVIIIDPDISFEGLMEHIEVRFTFFCKEVVFCRLVEVHRP